MVADVHMSAGVYRSEVDLSQRLLQVQSTIGAIVGRSHKGPVGKPTLVTSVNQFISLFGEPDPKYGYLHHCAITFLQQASQLYVVRQVNNTTKDALTAGAVVTVDDVNAASPNIAMSTWDDGQPTPAPLGKFDPANTYGFTVSDTNVLFGVYAVNPGAWNSEIYVQVRPYLKKNQTVPDNPYVFYVDIYLNYTGPSNAPVESFLVSRDPNALDGFSRSQFIEDVINKKSNYIRVTNNPNCVPIKVLVNAYAFFDGGADGTLPLNADYKAGWDLFADGEKIDVNILINGGLTDVGVQQHMDALAKSRMDCIAILDMPSDQQAAADAISYRKGTLNIDSSYSAIYSPDCLIYDQYNDAELYIPPSGLVAAAYAATDKKFALWFAPAGMTRGKLSLRGIYKKYDQGQRDALDTAQINTIRFIPGKGYNIWGQGTLQTMASALSNVNVRRLLCFIEKSIAVGALYSVFDPNDDFLRRSLVDICKRFLNPIQRGRGLDWFNAVCDGTNNSVQDVANGDLILQVYVDPVIPAKRILLTATIVKTGVTFKEVAAQSNPNG